jgi:hypothetical protein
MLSTNRKIFLAFAVMAITQPLTPNAFSQGNVEDSPVGTYVWFPDHAGPKSDDDCRKLVDRLKPSVEQAEHWQWGQMPNPNPENGPYYIIISKSRMEPTFSAEGDYDLGNLSLGPTKNGLTPFILAPDEHPEEKIPGTILAKPDSQIVVVTLQVARLDDGLKDRVIYYCRFDDPTGVET